jgi:hypothetical protein
MLMSRKHPQNGPSFSKATYKTKPLTDEERALQLAKERARKEEQDEKTQKARNFSEQTKKFGGSIPMRGPNADKFWAPLSENAPPPAPWSHLLTPYERKVAKEAQRQKPSDDRGGEDRPSATKKRSKPPISIRLR